MELKETGPHTRSRWLILSIVSALLCLSAMTFAQNGPPPRTPPPPPGELLKKINPFKKHKKDTASKTSDTTQNKQLNPDSDMPPPPQPPPNPFDLFKKKKKDTTKTQKSG